jgi:acyl-coenzyme A synthetase/AMP-(fatty) acid ligase
MNATAPILHFGKTRRNKPALVAGARSISYGELAELVRKTAGYLRGLGFHRGNRIGLCLKDSPDHVIALLGVAHMGGVAVPLDWRARPAENARFVDALKVSCVLTEEDARLAVGCREISMDATWHRGVACADQDIAATADWHDSFVISATSGSTGAPRFTVMTHWQYFFAMAGMLELMDLAGHHCFLCTLPLYYSGGRNSCLAHLLRGDCVVLYSSLFSPGEYLDVVNRQNITVGTLVPTTTRQLLAAPIDALAALRGLERLFCTGAPLHPAEKHEALRKLTPRFNERYGTAETLALSVLRAADMADRANSVGRPHSLAQVEIVDEADQPLQANAAGRMRLRSPGMGTPLPGQSEEHRFHDGWFYPGEIAHLDEDGFIFLSGRTSDVILRSGAKIYPSEVERVLLEHPGVIEAAVFGHPAGGPDEAVIAFVAPKDRLTAGELTAHCRIRLTPHKVPGQIHFMPVMPRNTAGKVDKLALAEYLYRNGL